MEKKRLRDERKTTVIMQSCNGEFHTIIKNFGITFPYTINQAAKDLWLNFRIPGHFFVSSNPATAVPRWP